MDASNVRTSSRSLGGRRETLSSSFPQSCLPYVEPRYYCNGILHVNDQGTGIYFVRNVLSAPKMSASYTVPYVAWILARMARSMCFLDQRCQDGSDHIGGHSAATQRARLSLATPLGLRRVTFA